MDLLEQIDWNALECLNASPEHSVNNALKQARIERSKVKPFCHNKNGINVRVLLEHNFTVNFVN